MLHRHLYCNSVLKPFAVNDLIIKRSLAFVKVCDEFFDTALIVEGMFMQFLSSPVPQYNSETFCKECHFSESLFQRVIVKYNIVKYFRIRIKGYLCAGPLRLAVTDDFQFIADFSSFISLFIYLSFMIDLHFQPFGEGIYNRCTYTVETAGYFVSSAAEFSAGMKHSKYDFHCRKSCLMVDSHRNTSSVVAYGNRTVLVDINLYFITVSRQCLIH